MSIRLTKTIFFAIALTAGLLYILSTHADAATPVDYPAGATANGIVNTRHNLGTTGRVLATHKDGGTAPITAIGAEGTSEVCIFCHTPHHGSTNAPLWNKGAQSTTYLTYGTTIGGTSADTTPGAATLACLSCHDGVNTFDTIVNWPGKSGAGTNAGATTTDMGWRFGMPDGWDGALSLDHFDASAGSPCNLCHNEGELFAIAYPEGNPSYSLDLGTDLRNDHPVSITYTENRASLRPVTTQITSVTMENDVLTVVATTTDSATTTENLWAVGGYLNPTATIQDLLRNGKVECSSCHDPHFDNQSWDEVEPVWGNDGANYSWCSDGEDCSDGLFLRRIGGNSLSGVCRTCHNK